MNKKTTKIILIATVILTTLPHPAAAKNLEDMSCRELRAELRVAERLADEAYDEADAAEFIGDITGDPIADDYADDAELVGDLIEFEIDDIEDEMDLKGCR